MEPPTDLIAWLAEDEAKSRPYRAERAAFLIEHFGGEERGMMFHGGLISFQAFDEMRLCYLHGLFISCVVIAQVVIEHTLSRMMSAGGRNDLEGASFKKLLDEAQANGLISAADYDALDELRRLRNPYTHTKPYGHESCILDRAAQARSHPWYIFKEDAEKAIIAVFDLLAREPFTFHYNDEELKWGDNAS